MSGVKLVSKAKIMDIFKHLKARIKKTPTDKVEFVGGLRRGKPSMKDLDILTNVTLNKCADRIGIPLADQKITESRHKLTFTFRGVQIDINYAKASDWPYALLHHTGDYMFNIYMRAHAKKMGYKLNQYGLFSIKSGKKVPKTNFKTEKQIFNFLHFPYREPFERINGEKIFKGKKSLTTFAELFGGPKYPIGF